jgi:hypothetical protein
VVRGKERVVPLRRVMGPNGKVLTIGDLPPRTTKRWVKRRKAEVVLGVNGGLISLEEACRRYDLTVEEFACWERAMKTERVKSVDDPSVLLRHEVLAGTIRTMLYRRRIIAA